jgi:myosin protein heavy chain
VAVSAALIGRASKQTERYIQSAASEATSSREELLRTGQAGLVSNDRTIKKISRLEENQRQLLDKLRELKKIPRIECNQRQLLENLAELKNLTESRHNFLHKATDSLHEATQGCGQEMAESAAAVTSSNETLQTRMDGLMTAVKLMSGTVSTAVDNQESVRGAVKEYSELLDGRISDMAEEHQELSAHVDGLRELMRTVAGDIGDVAREQASLHETVEIRGEESARRIENLSENHTNVRNHLDQLGENIKQASAEAVAQLVERVASRETFQANAEVLDAQLSGLADAHEQLRGHVDSLRELMQSVAGDVNNVARDQATLHETVKNRGEESVRRLETLSQDHRAVQNRVDQLGETVKHVSAEAAELISQRVASHDSFRAHAETLDAQLSGLAGAQEQLRDHVDGLKELLQAVAGDVTNVAREQATLHEAVETKGKESIHRMETLSEESARRFETLSKDHENVRSDLEQVCENVEHASAEAVEQVTQRVVSRKSFQTQAEALSVKLSGLAGAQEQLRGYVEGLRELVQTVAGDVTDVAREQTNLHEAVETRGEESVRRLETLSEEFDRRLEAISEESTGRLEALSQDHAHVHNHLDQLGENVKQASSEAAEQVAQRVASRESFQAHAEMLDLQLSGLGTAQEQLRSHICGLREILQGVAGDVTGVSRGQATLHEAVEARGRDSAHRLETLSEDHRSVQRHVDQLGETVRQVTTDAVKLVAMRVATRESFEAHTEALDTQLSGLAAAQDQMRGHVFSLKGVLQAVASNVTDVARKQMNLHETVEAKGTESARHLETLSEESVRRLEALSEDHKNVHNHLDRLGEDVKQASSEAAETLSEDHRNVHSHLDRLGEDIRQASSEATEALSVDHSNVHSHLDRVGEDVKQAGCEALETLARQVTSCESFEAHTEALDTQFSGLATAQEQLRSHIGNLRELVQAVAGDVSDVALEQANLHEAVEAKGEESVHHMDTLSQKFDRRLETLWEESAGRLETLSEDHASVHIHLDQLGEDVTQTAETLSEESVRHHEALSQDHRYVHSHLDRLGEDVKQTAETLSEKSVRRLEALSEDHRNVHSHLDQLGEDAKQAAEALSEEAVRHREALSQDHRYVHSHLDRLGEDARQTAESLSEKSVRHHEALSEDHKNVHSHLDRLGEDVKQAAETLSEESVRHREALSEDHRNVHSHLDQLGEDVKQTAETLSEESVRHLEALSEDHRNVDSHLDRLGEDARQTAETLTEEAVRRHEALSEDHRNVRSRLDRLGEDARQTAEALSEEAVRHHEALSEDHRNVRSRLDRLGEDARQTAETLSEEAVRHHEALSEDHRNVHSHLNRLGEDVRQAGAETVDQVTQQVASRESFQAHSEALDVQLSGLATAHKQLRGHVDGLRELMQTVADDVTKVAGEQATLHEEVETKGEEAARRLETLSAGHKATHVQLDHLGENVRQVGAEAVETIAQRVASRESFQAHVEALDAQLPRRSTRRSIVGTCRYTGTAPRPR